MATGIDMQQPPPDNLIVNLRYYFYQYNKKGVTIFSEDGSEISFMSYADSYLKMELR